jgi:hypothetical protein
VDGFLQAVRIFIFRSLPMTQRELNRAVARATGDSVREIRRRGFSMANPAEVNFDPEPDLLPPLAVNWDRLDSQRMGLFPARHIKALSAGVEA